jgi:high affinity sulfate transporter 1
MLNAYTPSVFRYKKKYLKSDVLAALVVTAIAVPESLAFAVIVGLPPVTGLYSALLAPIVFGVLASTRRLVIGADSATAALIAAGAVLVAQVGTAGYANAVAVIGLLVAAILMLMAVFRLGFLSNLISRPVLIGFLGGVGVQLIITKFPEMLGLRTSGTVWQHLVDTFANLTQINGMTLTVAVLVAGVILLSRKTKIPGELVGLVLAGVFATIFHVQDYGVALVGQLPHGLPAFSHPALTVDVIVTLFPAALSIAIVILAQSSAVIRNLANEHEDKVKINQDLFSLGIANAASALTHGFSVNGSPPRSAAADIAGGKTQLVGILMSVFIALMLLFGGDLLKAVPTAALATIVFMIGIRLLRIAEFKYLWHRHRAEFTVAMVALLATALFGVRQGLFLAVIVSLVERLARQYHPRDEVLLRDGELSVWAQERVDQHHRHSSRPPGLLVYSFESSLFFENIGYFRARLLKAIAGAKEPVTYVIIDAGAMDSIDYTAVENIKQLLRQLSSDNIKVGFAHVSPNLYEQFTNYGMLDIVGSKNIFSTLNAAIKSHPGNKRTVFEMVDHLKIPRTEYVIIGGAVLEALELRETGDIDLVVSDEVYDNYRDEQNWQEYVQDNGKRILSRNGYNLMHSWMGKSFSKLQKTKFELQGHSFMAIEELIDAKKRLARSKDLSDIELLEAYMKTKK